MKRNPYSAPSGNLVRESGWFGGFRLPVRFIGWLMFLAFWPVSWFAIELANQEYWQLWHRRFSLISLEFGGQVISMSTVLWVLVVVAILLFVMSTACLRLTGKPGNG